MWLKPVTLNGKICTLEPLSHKHHVNLAESVKDGELWKACYSHVPQPERVEEEISRRLTLQTKGEMLPFAVVYNETGKAIGMTTYGRTDSKNRRLEIGWTWYASSHQRTGLNTECKFLLLQHAFETLDCIAVGFRVDTLNKRSQQAVERLGATYEGTIRNHSLTPNGHLQDMRVYSILPSEWAKIKAHLCWLMDRDEIR